MPASDPRNKYDGRSCPAPVSDNPQYPQCRKARPLKVQTPPQLYPWPILCLRARTGRIYRIKKSRQQTRPAIFSPASCQKSLQRIQQCQNNRNTDCQNRKLSKNFNLGAQCRVPGIPANSGSKFHDISDACHFQQRIQINRIDTDHILDFLQTIQNSFQPQRPIKKNDIDGVKEEQRG